MVQWIFEKKRRSQKSREPMQASFFTSASIDDDAHALVREAIQNALDAKTSPESAAPVVVRFAVGELPAGDPRLDVYISVDAWGHFSAKDNGLNPPPAPRSSCRYLVYEDFRTTGLIGNEVASEPEEKNSFYYFMRAEGQSGKEDGARGRHGIGKYVFPHASGLRMFLAATVRSTDKRALVAGQCVLKSHEVDGHKYTPDAWWGEFEKDGEDDYFPLPVEDSDVFNKVCSDFGLLRTNSDPGLSLVMPYIRDDMTTDVLAAHVVNEYFFPILSGQLVVEVESPERKREITADSVRDDLEQLLKAVDARKIGPYVELADHCRLGGEVEVVTLERPKTPSLPKWDATYLSPEAAKQIREALSLPGNPLVIRCPVYVKPEQGGDAEVSHFDILIAKNVGDKVERTKFLREGISIPEERVTPVRGYTSIVVIDAGRLATLLGDSENPAHTEWEKNAGKFRGKYKWGPTTIDFVRLSVGKMLKLLSQDEEEEDSRVLSDIFYINLPDDDEGVPPQRRKRKDKEGKDERDPPPPPPPPTPKTYRIQKYKSGFAVAGPKTPLAGRRKYKISTAYDIVNGTKARALKAYHKNDFDLSKKKGISGIAVKNLDITARGDNWIEFETDDHNFVLAIDGFDTNRDIIVDVDSRVSDDA